MQVYNLGYHTYEESDTIQLYHKERFSKKEFEKIVAEATIHVLKEHKIEKVKRMSFQDVFYDVAEELIKSFGFKEVKFDSEFNIFGWADILDEKDWKHDRDEQLNRLTAGLHNKSL